MSKEQSSIGLLHLICAPPLLRTSEFFGVSRRFHPEFFGVIRIFHAEFFGVCRRFHRNSSGFVEHFTGIYIYVVEESGILQGFDIFRLEFFRGSIFSDWNSSGVRKNLNSLGGLQKGGPQQGGCAY